MADSINICIHIMIEILKNGTIKESEALELLTCLWIKTLTINKVRSQAHTLSSAGSPMYQKCNDCRSNNR